VSSLSRRWFLVVAAVLAVAFAVGALAAAGPGKTAVTDSARALDDARAAIARRAWPDVVSALERALQIVRGEAPLVVRQARLVREPHAGLGAWTAAPTTGTDAAAVVDGRNLRLYVEVDNVVDEALPDGRRRLALGVRGRFALQNDDGSKEELGEKDLGRQELALWRTTGVHSFGVDVALSDKAPPGRYVLTVVVVDEIGHKSGERAMPFVLR
jgi:hypothetical protein